jgi:UDP-N-acetylmuramoylalanine--D-glutamate ligase
MTERPFFAGANALVVGAARSGVAAAKLLRRYGAHVRVVDRRSPAELSAAVRDLGPLGVELRLGATEISALEGRTLVIVSPGVPPDLPLLREAERRGLAIAAELELGHAVAKAPIVAVTGTNGKSTTVELLGAIGRAAGRATEVLGNIGTALSERAEEVPAEGLLIVEVSSFQLESCSRFKPKVGVLLNVTPDHLDRHGTMGRYAAIKARLFERQDASDVRVQPLGDALITDLLRPMRSHPLWFGFADPTADGAWLDGDTLRWRFQGSHGSFLRRDEVPLPGPHNTENVTAAAAAALSVGIPPAAITKALREFKGLPHRLTLVATIDGVRYINDSKATNVDSMRRALESYDPPVVLIAGGRDKDGDFAAVTPLVLERVRHLVTLGEAAEKLEGTWPQVPTTRAATIEAAVAAARSHATPGGVVLLSPGCASYDMFRNFEDRGARFEAAVHALERERAGAGR